MQATLRPLATAGIALVGASAIAIAPGDAPSPVAQVSSPVQLAAATTILGPDQSTLDSSHAAFYNLLPALNTLGVVTISPGGRALVDFSTSSPSGVLLGLAGPIAGPSVLLSTNLQSVAAHVAAGDVPGALNTLAATPGAIVDAFLYGGVHVDLTPLVQAVGPGLGLQFPDGVKVGVAFGGLLSPAGSAFNALDLDFSLQLGSLPIGAISLAGGTGPGALASLGALVGGAVQGLSGTLTGQSATADRRAATATPLREKTTRESVKALPTAPRNGGGKHRAVETSAKASGSTATPGAKAAPTGQGKHAKSGKHAAA